MPKLGPESTEVQHALSVLRRIRTQLAGTRPMAKVWDGAAVTPSPWRRAVADALRDWKCYSPEVMGNATSAVGMLVAHAIAHGRELERQGAPRPRVLSDAEAKAAIAQH